MGLFRRGRQRGVGPDSRAVPHTVSVSVIAAPPIPLVCNTRHAGSPMHTCAHTHTHTHTSCRGLGRGLGVVAMGLGRLVEKLSACHAGARGGGEHGTGASNSRTCEFRVFVADDKVQRLSLPSFLARRCPPCFPPSLFLLSLSLCVPPSLFLSLSPLPPPPSHYSVLERL